MAVLKPFQLGIIVDILKAYQYDQPFHHYFSGLAKQHRNWGSKDRKTYRNACYAYFRMGFLSEGKEVSEMVLKALQLQEEIPTDEDIQAIFPFKNVVSEQINYKDWVSSHLKQKPVYLIIRKNYAQDCQSFLQQNQIPFNVENDFCLRLPPDSKCDALTDHGLAWVMDKASAEATNAITLNKNELVWDACAGAGGKSLFLSQKYEGMIQMTCSDKRFTVLENLKARFLKLGLDLPKVELIDLMSPSHLSAKYDSIILDVPCSGSGTWGRTPEQIRSFDPTIPEKFAIIQRKIVSNAIKNLKSGGKLFYLTCSVFSEENENTVDYIEHNFGLKCINSSYYFEQHTTSDTLFLASFTRV